MHNPIIILPGSGQEKTAIGWDRIPHPVFWLQAFYITDSNKSTFFQKLCDSCHFSTDTSKSCNEMKRKCFRKMSTDKTEFIETSGVSLKRGKAVNKS